MKLSHPLFASPLRARSLLTAIVAISSLPYVRAAEPAPKAETTATGDDAVIESGPFIVTEKSLGVIPLNGRFRYSRLTGRVRSPIVILGTMRRDLPLSDFGVKAGEQIHAVNGQEITRLSRKELIKLWMETGDAGDPLTLTLASATAKGAAFREVKMKRVSPRAKLEPKFPDSPVVLALIEKARAKQLRDDSDFTEDLAALDALIAAHAGAKTQEAAKLVLDRITLVALVAFDVDAAQKSIAQLKTDYPTTKASHDADKLLATFEREHAKQNAPAVRSLVGQPAPALDFIWSTRPGLKNLANLKGKVVVLTFWAPGSRQSIYAFPHLKFIADYYPGTAVEVVSVTSLMGRGPGPDGNPIDTRGKPDKEMGLLKKYAADKGLTWTVAMSRQPAMNPDYAVQQIPSLTLIAPDGTIRANGLNPLAPLRPKIDALLKEFALATPNK